MKVQAFFSYQSQHYNITLDQICHRLEDQQHISIDRERKRIQFKRKIKCLDLPSYTENDAETDQDIAEKEQKLLSLIPDILLILKSADPW